ncbi:MAG: FAD-dependent thymidylate synthase [Dehalococcoidia bacterium]|nr:FAD-dependent thymidylate synthase [Dehalococcoidia bacterium]MCA9824525.1 FAD-dependent thymidylate synthase [Dehalococcoidia bacterium]MCA9844417.1 FAD-dependent thymidylate synthase [Dehalococcoidia bacterium]MCA9855596.1 FAD-dependent thymidylate synthase [Dehalococcoidia bacterium]
MAIQVTLLSHTDDPLRSLYMAYRTCYSALTPQQVAARIEDERIPRDKMQEFITERLKTGHASPLEQIHFEFGISGVSRAFSHQFVRHRVGISFEQQSQRYVTYKGGTFPYTVPQTVEKAGLTDEMRDLFSAAGDLYEKMVAAGVPAEDARFLLPNATNTNFKITVNFQALLHIADLRLCTRAQWEFRRVVALMRGEVMKVAPELGRYLQPKCGEHRMGYCDETEKDWEECPIGRVRPHKTALFRIYDSYRKGELQPLREEDWAAIEEIGEGDPAEAPATW